MKQKNVPLIIYSMCYVLVLCGGVQLVKNYRPTVKCREAIDNWYEGKIKMALTQWTQKFKMN